MDRKRYFFLTEQEAKSADVFEKKHSKCGDRKHSFMYCFTFTGIGNKVCIRCNSCEETKDITDVTTW
jgi:hypothetical protein